MLDEALKVFDELKKEYKPVKGMYNHLISTYLKKGNLAMVRVSVCIG